MKKLIKKLIVVVRLAGLTTADFMKSIRKKQQSVAASSLASGIVPTPDEVKTKINKMQDSMDAHVILLKSAAEKVIEISEMRGDLTDIMADQWANYIQLNVTTVKEVKDLGFDSKGDKEKTPLSQESRPLISGIGTNVKGKHILNFINSLNEKKALPPGILRIDLYGLTGGDAAPTNLTDLMSKGGGCLGQVSKAKFIYETPSSGSGKLEYYIAVYISKATLKPFSQSEVVSARIS